MTPNAFDHTSGTDGAMVSDIDDPNDARLDYFRDLNSIDRRPDLPSGKGLVIAEGVLAIEMAALAGDLELTIHPHPTLSETVMEAAEVFFGTSTDVYRPKRS